MAYAGPATLRGRVTLRANVHGATRVVAVTFMLARRPLGTVTAPWALDVDTLLLPAGKAQCRRGDARSTRLPPGSTATVLGAEEASRGGATGWTWRATFGIFMLGFTGADIGRGRLRRAYIPKADGRLRPLGVAALEDKILQRAVVEVLNAVYEADFLGFRGGLPRFLLRV